MDREHEIQKFAEKMEERFKEFDNPRQGPRTWNEAYPLFSCQQIETSLKEIRDLLSGESEAFKHESELTKEAGVQQAAIEIANYALMIYISQPGMTGKSDEEGASE